MATVPIPSAINQENTPEASLRGFTALVSDALRACSPETNRKAWIGRLATDLNVSDRAVEGWLYGETVPSACALVELCRLLGKRFADAVLVSSGLVTFRKESAEAASAELAKAALTAALQIEGVAETLRKAVGK